MQIDTFASGTYFSQVSQKCKFYEEIPKKERIQHHRYDFSFASHQRWFLFFRSLFTELQDEEEKIIFLINATFYISMREYESYAFLEFVLIIIGFLSHSYRTRAFKII